MPDLDDNKAYIAFRASIDMAMGVLYCGISVYAMKHVMLLEKYGRNTVYTIGILFSLYGIFRIIRGAIKIKDTFLNKRTPKNFKSETFQND